MHVLRAQNDSHIHQYWELDPVMVAEAEFVLSAARQSALHACKFKILI